MSYNTDAPDITEPEEDTGAKTQRRYLYQAMCAARFSLELLPEKSKISCIYCEYHDDIIIKMTNGKFRFFQVKTRLEDRNYFKTSDNKIISTISKFIKHEQLFSEYIEKFYIVSNQSFWAEKKNFENLDYLIKQVKYDNINFNTSHVLRKLCSTLDLETDEKKELFKRVLKKTSLVKQPALESIEFHLADDLRQLFGEDIQTYDDFNELAKQITNLCLEFSTQDLYAEELSRYLFASLPNSNRQKEIIESRRITKEKLLTVINEFGEKPFLLQCYEDWELPSSPSSRNKSIQKMEKGQVDQLNIALASDLKLSYEYAVIQWGKKFGFNEAQKRYNHINTLVLSRCKEIYDKLITRKQIFGQEMWVICCNEINDLIIKKKEELFDLNQDRLKGVMSLLTNKCKLWWSEEFTLTEDTNIGYHDLHTET